jgi:outer membrane immunogenic protein
MKTLLVAGLAFGALIAPAMAADLPVKAPPPPLFSSTGFYIGGNVGWGEALPYCTNPGGAVMGVGCPDVFGGRVLGDGFVS